jgi:hypothetical protein
VHRLAHAQKIRGAIVDAIRPVEQRRSARVPRGVAKITS